MRRRRATVLEIYLTILTVFGALFLFHVFRLINQPCNCCPYPREHSILVEPVQDDEAIRKIMDQEHKDQEELQRQKYLERHKNGCSEVDWEEWAREQGYEDFHDYAESFGGA